MGRTKILKKLYNAIYRSKIDYGCHLYSTVFPGRLKNPIAYTCTYGKSLVESYLNTMNDREDQKDI